MPGVLQGMVGTWFALCEGVTAGSLMLLFAGFADLLNKDFHTDQKFTLTTYTSSGAVSISGFFTPSAVSCAIFCMLRLLVWLLFLRFLVFLGVGMWDAVWFCLSVRPDWGCLCCRHCTVG